MNKRFQFKGVTFEIYSNGKIYNGRQYFSIKEKGSYQKAATGEWSHTTKCWAKQPGNADWNEAIAREAGLIDAE